MGALSSGAGTLDIFQAYADVFDGGVGDIGAGYWHGTGRYDNTVAYVTPDMAGLKLYAQYGFQNDGSEKASARDNSRYWGVGATYDNGPLALVAVFDSVQPANKSVDDLTKEYALKGDLTKLGLNQDSFTLSFGGSYDFGSFKPFVGVQYGKHMNTFGGIGNFDYNGGDFAVADLKGYALSLGSTFDLPCGTLTGVLYYAHSKGDSVFATDKGKKFQSGLIEAKGNLYGIGLVHAYPLSKRTTFYSGVGYAYGKYTGTGGIVSDDRTEIYGGDETVKTKNAQVLFGLNHTF